MERLCWDTTTSCSTTFVTSATTAYGDTTYTIPGLVSRQTYYVYVKALDQSSNLETSSHGTSGTTATSYDTFVKPVFTVCGACHDGTFQPGPWTDFSKTINVAPTSAACTALPGGGPARIVPGNPAGSLLYDKMTATPACGARMPQGGPYDTTNMQYVYDWILQGANAN